MLVEHATIGTGDLLEHGRCDLLTAVGEGGVRTRHVDHVRGGDAEGDGPHGAESRRGRGDARAYGRIDNGGVADLLREADVHAVDRALGALQQRDLAPRDVAVVVDLVSVDRDAGVAVPHRVQADALLDAGREREGLECRPRLAHRLRGVVERTRDVVGAAVHRHDLAGAGSHRSEPDAQTLGAGRGRLVLHGLHRGLLGIAVERRDHAKSAAVDVVLGESVVEQRLAHRVEQVAVGPDPVGEAALGDEGREHRGGLLLGRDPALLHHAVEDVVVALLQLEEVGIGVVAAGRSDDGRQRCGLTEGQLVGRNPVVGLGRRLDAVGAASEVDGVEVVLEDLVLGHRGIELEGQDELLDLARERAVLGEESVLRVLLGDRRATLETAALDVVPDGANDALG